MKVLVKELQAEDYLGPVFKDEDGDDARHLFTSMRVVTGISYRNWFIGVIRHIDL